MWSCYDAEVATTTCGMMPSMIHLCSCEMETAKLCPLQDPVDVWTRQERRGLYTAMLPSCNTPYVRKELNYFIMYWCIHLKIISGNATKKDVLEIEIIKKIISILGPCRCAFEISIENLKQTQKQKNKNNIRNNKVNVRPT